MIQLSVCGGDVAFCRVTLFYFVCICFVCKHDV